MANVISKRRKNSPALRVRYSDRAKNKAPARKRKKTIGIRFWISGFHLLLSLFRRALRENEGACRARACVYISLKSVLKTSYGIVALRTAEKYLTYITCADDFEPSVVSSAKFTCHGAIAKKQKSQVLQDTCIVGTSQARCRRRSPEIYHEYLFFLLSKYIVFFWQSRHDHIDRLSLLFASAV